MTQKPKDSGEGLELAAADLVTQLGCIYEAYLEQNTRSKQTGQKMTHLFHGWFASQDPSAVEPLHQDFLANVENSIVQLEILLRELIACNPNKCHIYAAQAIALIMVQNPKFYKTNAEWYLTVAEYYSEGLFAYLAQEDLRRIYNEYIRCTPKYKMFPKQKELCKKMKSILASRNCD